MVQALPGAVLLLAGRGELECHLKKRVSELGLEKSVRFLGVVDDVPRLLRAADVFVFPSINEGLALSVVEAQASGLPTIVSTGVPELAVVSDRVYRIPLSSGVETWATECVDKLRFSLSSERSDACDQVREHGFDIADTSVRLAAFYETAKKGDCAQW